MVKTTSKEDDDVAVQKKTASSIGSISKKANDIFHKYQQQAIDFSRRNRLLKYPNKALRIEFNLKLEECEGYFGKIEELSVDFPHKKILDAEENDGKLIKDTEAEEPFDPRTNVIGKKLISSLDRFRLQSKKNFEEHGLNTLFLVIGEIKWKEKTGSRGSSDVARVQDYIAPLLLIPIAIENTKAPYKATNLSINTDQDPIRINPVLLSFMKQTLDVRMPDLPEDLSQISYLELRDIFAEFKNIFHDAGITIEKSEKVYIGQFSFHGQQIYEDLHKNEAKIIQHPFIYGICSGETFDSNSNESIKVDDDYNSDDFLNEEEDFTILDADSSQIAAIKKIVSGEDMVIHGPPGTGKSQTIANIISNLLARDKTVLFVCEKQVALDVVYKRLSSENGAGVADLCLPLFKYASNKKQFAADIIGSRDSLLREIRKNGRSRLSSKITERKEKIEFLKTYAEEVIKAVEPFGKNLYWIFGQLGDISAKSREISVVWNGNGSPTQLSVKDLSNHRQALKDLVPFLSLLDETNNLWNGLKKRNFSPDFASRVIDILKKTGGHIEENPHTKKGIKYASLDKALTFFQKITDHNFRNLFDQRLLKLKTVEQDYLKNVIEKIQSIQVVSSNYNSKNEGDKFEFADTWQAAKDLKINMVSGSVLLESIHANGFTKSVEWLAESSLKFPAGLPKSISDLSVKDFEKRIFLFGIDYCLIPVILKSKTDLYDLSNQLKSLQNIHSQIEQSQKILQKYSVNLMNVSREEVLALENNFTQKYKTFLRFFSGDYKKDKNKVVSWCGLIKPDSHAEIKNVSFAAAIRLKLETSASEDWQKIAQNFGLNSEEAKKLPLQYFLQKIDVLVKYLDDNSLEFVEPYLQTILLDQKKNAILHNKAQTITAILSECSKIQTFLKVNILDQKVYDIESFFVSLQSEVVLIKKLSEKIAKFVKHDSTTSVDILEADINTLNALKKSIVEAEKFSPLEFIESDIKTIITEPELLSKALIFADCLLNMSEDIPEIGFPDFENTVNYATKNEDSMVKWNSKLDNLISEVSVLFENENLKNIYLEYPLDKFSGMIRNLIKDKEGLKQWIEYQKQRHLGEEMGLGWFIEEIAKKVKDIDYEIDEIYVWIFLNKWLEDYFVEKPILRNFNLSKYQQVVAQFKKLDVDSLDVNRMRIIQGFLNKLEASRSYGGDAEKVLQREAEKKKQHIPIRTLVKRYAHHLQKIKPCWMVSPLALGSYLEYGSVDFDVVIFDEASQMRIESALGAISRGKQVVVIGDEHQLPPTSFFGISLDDEDDENEEVVEETGFESILQRAISLVNGSEKSLEYHYRSASEDLIAFSNHYIYKVHGRQLITFPNAKKNDAQGVKFDLVKNGFYDGGNEGTKTNPKEAEHVANLCIKIAEENSGSLGVIAFSKSQEKAIRKELEIKLKSYPHLADKLDETSTDRDSFFIKNLESVQGDERDKIILSICYGPDKVTGKVRNHFGPLNQNNGYRRLNVAVTRAREQLICVSSMHAYDMHPPEGTRGAKLLQQYLEYAEKGIASLEASKIVEDNSGVEADSDFELSVEAELIKRGYKVHRQVGASGFKIDLAIVNLKNNNEYILGIECDGATYHSTKSARIRDRIRQDVLERLGWKIYRIWSQHWFTNKSDIIEDIIRECNSY